MVKHKFFFQKVSLFFLTLFTSINVPGAFAGNMRHDRELIFEKPDDPNTAVNFIHTSKASSLHERGYKGKGTTIAIVDNYFDPQHTATLMKKGVIHPEVLKQKLVVTPNEKLEKVNPDNIWVQQHTKKELLSSVKTKKEENKLQEEIKDLENLSHRKLMFDIYKDDKEIHGSLVMDAAHKIAPEATLLPIAKSLINYDPSLNVSQSQGIQISTAINTAIQHHADVISISLSLTLFSDEIITALQAAQKKGIAVIMSSGNDSDTDPAFLQRMWDKVKSVFVKSNKMKVFEALGKKGILFSGALHYDIKEGEEEIANFTSMPNQETYSNFILAPGDNLSLAGNTVSGTSFSAPITAAGYALLKQYTLANKLSHLSVDDHLKILHASGHQIKHSPWKSLLNPTPYKVLNLKNAAENVDQLLKAAATSTKTKSVPSPILPAPIKTTTPKPPKTTLILQQTAPKSVAVSAKTAAKKVPEQSKEIKSKKPALKGSIEALPITKSKLTTISKKTMSAKKIKRLKRLSKKRRKKDSFL